MHDSLDYALVDWTALGAIAAAASAFILVCTLGVLWWQIYELRKATYAQAYATFVSWLQDESSRRDRGVLFGLYNKPNWTDEDKKLAERVCHRWDIVANMVKSGMLPERILIDDWSQPLIKSWMAAEEKVIKKRREIEQGLWSHFEWAMKRAVRKHGPQEIYPSPTPTPRAVESSVLVQDSIILLVGDKRYVVPVQQVQS